MQGQEKKINNCIGFIYRKRLRKEVREMNAAFRKEMAELEELEKLDADLGKLLHKNYLSLCYHASYNFVF